MKLLEIVRDNSENFCQIMKFKIQTTNQNPQLRNWKISFIHKSYHNNILVAVWGGGVNNFPFSLDQCKHQGDFLNSFNFQEIACKQRFLC